MGVRVGASVSQVPKINFVVAGAQKSGTTALRHFLSQHPQIGVCRPEVREPHFFSRHYLKHALGDYAPYHAMFSPHALAARATGDITPVYMYLDGCLERIRDYNPNMKIIVLLRNPVLRARSQWAMNVERNPAFGGFARSLVSEQVRRLRVPQDVERFLLQRGFYSEQLQRLFRIFSRQNCLVLKHETFRANHAETLAQIYGFLGLDTVPPPVQETVHARAYTPMPQWLHAALIAVYYRDIRRVEAMLGWDCSDWLRLPRGGATG